MVCPFLFLTAVFCLTCGLLTWDWKKKRRFFPHHSSNRNSETQPSCVNNPIIKNQTKPKNKNGAKPFWRRNQKFLKAEKIEPKNISSIELKPIQRNSAPARYLPRSPPSPCRPNSPPPSPPSGLVQLKLNSGLQAPRQPPRLD
ncbi:uncharacterized protein LOC111713663 [Eurytemora carolleeae]|uniref:uncharacterized protein LOC111713663 n=1 Tax=Eurytemora carolleeae TaxID=1294199 RepID=UPI000C76369F|nr:uncharacterized protein LOC111713663 [Eurytemora carolleeae]|eukprot:XP_023344356.1 uncharacterized protein LOC111713663 [Eurytemora affinis]